MPKAPYAQSAPKQRPFRKNSLLFLIPAVLLAEEAVAIMKVAIKETRG
jgi:hypothetical protein